MPEEKMPGWMTQRLIKYDAVVREARALFTHKNIQYGESFVEFGALGTVLNLRAMSKRARRMVLAAIRGEDSDLPKLQDILIDLVNYSIMAFMTVAEDNLAGRE